MTQIDLDDLPPRIAKVLAELGEGVDLNLVQSGVLVATLRRVAVRAPSTTDDPAVSQEEVLDHFNAMIHDEF
ncbi:MAG TPA: hypothetical protein VGI30_01705 [Caulobacteraceae bacterium]